MDWKGMQMKNNKNKIIQIMVFLLLIIFITPNLNASILKKTIDEDESLCTGMIYGHTHTAYCWSWVPVNFAFVDAGIKNTYSTFNGFYVLSGLPLGKTYTVTASKKGYNAKMHQITLTRDCPVVKQFFDLQPIDENVKLIKDEKEIIVNNSFNFGIIIGKTFWRGGWGFGHLPFVNIFAIGKYYYRNKKSGAFGNFYIILPLDKDITITAYKKGYDSDVKTVKLTKDERFKIMTFTLQIL
jgi:hypothetical protein